MSYKSRITLSIGCLSNAHLKRKHGMFGQQSERAFKIYRMNVACRKSLYTQPGENRNKYDNGWIKKRFVFETGSISQINSKTFACTQLKYIATASVKLKPILGYRITLIKRTTFPRFFLCQSLCLHQYPPMWFTFIPVYFIYHPLTPKFISNVLITGFFLSAFLLQHTNLIQVCKNDTFHILPKTDFGVIK